MPSYPKPCLYIGNRNYSSWSLRAWLCLKWANIDFDEVLIELDQDGYGESRIPDILAVTPSGKVPAMRIGTEVIWDTIAIAEWAAENAIGVSLIPGSSIDRARMWSAIGEMHAGFPMVRQELPMNIHRRCRATGYAVATAREVARTDSLWQIFRQRARKQDDEKGDYLMGAKCIVDAFYLPVATRFRSYGISLSSLSQQYLETLLADAAFLEWEATSLNEGIVPFSRARIDDLYQAN